MEPHASHSALPSSAVSGRDRIDFDQLSLQCRRGLDGTCRAEAWKVMMGFYTLTPDQWSSIDERSVDEYEGIITSVVQSSESDHADPGLTLPHAIALDVPRTMTTLHFFSTTSTPPSSASQRFGTSFTRETTSHPLTSSFTDTQRCLFRILLTSARVNRGLSYLQGMNELAAHLLYAYCQGDPSRLSPSIEAAAFFSFQTLLIHLGDDFTSIHADGRPGVVATVRQFANMLLFFNPPLHAFLAQTGIQPEMFALRWLMLLFTQEFNIADALRVWDFLLSFGDQLRTVALYVAVAMCHEQSDTLLSQPSLADVMHTLLNYPPGDVDTFLRVAVRWIHKYGVDFALRFRTATPEAIAQWRVDYGLAPPPSLVTRFGGWLQSFVNPEDGESHAQQ